MAIIAVHGTELIIFSRIEGQLAPLGHQVHRVRAGQIGEPADLVLCDVEQVDAEWAVRELRPAKLLGFGSHEQPAALKRAKAAGFDKVVARSAVATRLAALTDELLGS